MNPTEDMGTGTRNLITVTATRLRPMWIGTSPAFRHRQKETQLNCYEQSENTGPRSGHL